MLTADEHDFFSYLAARGDTTILAGYPVDAIPEALRALLEDQRQLSLVNTVLRPEYPPTESSTDGALRFDPYRSACIEWSRCLWTDGALVAGRIFAKVGWLRSEEHNKTQRAWYNSIERWLKKRMTKIEGGWWITGSAQQWSIKGGILSFGGGPALRKSLADPDATQPDGPVSGEAAG